MKLPHDMPMRNKRVGGYFRMFPVILIIELKLFPLWRADYRDEIILIIESGYFRICPVILIIEMKLFSLWRAVIFAYVRLFSL